MEDIKQLHEQVEGNTTIEIWRKRVNDDVTFLVYVDNDNTRELHFTYERWDDAWMCCVRLTDILWAHEE